MTWTLVEKYNNTNAQHRERHFSQLRSSVVCSTKDLPEISFNELTQLVAGYLLDSNPPHEDVRINVNQQTQVRRLGLSDIFFGDM